VGITGVWVLTEEKNKEIIFKRVSHVELRRALFLES